MPSCLTYLILKLLTIPGLCRGMLASRLSFDLRKMPQTTSARLGNSKDALLRLLGQATGAMIRLVTRNKRREKVQILRKDQHSQQSKNEG